MDLEFADGQFLIHSNVFQETLSLLFPSCCLDCAPSRRIFVDKSVMGSAPSDGPENTSCAKERRQISIIADPKGGIIKYMLCLMAPLLNYT
jgi:hypothetical protein